MTEQEIMQALAAPFAAKDVEWRGPNTTQDHTRGMAVPYIDSRAIQNRLDAVVGIYNWKTEYRPWHQVMKGERQQGGKEPNASQLCGLSIYCKERQEWIPKWDGAENSDIEPVKGGLSENALSTTYFQVWQSILPTATGCSYTEPEGNTPCICRQPDSI